MIAITLYKFEKNTNSTKIPTSTGVTADCLIRERSSIINPVIELSAAGNISRVFEYNYVYINYFSRYYFVDDIVYENNKWILYLKIDVLGSYRTEIFNSRQYVLRNADTYDDTIIDKYYPTTAEVDTGISTNYTVVKQGSTSIPNYFNLTIADGCFVLGIIGENTGGVSYYSFAYSSFKTLINNLMAFVPSDMTDVSTGIAKQIANPIQYMTSCYWYPWCPVGEQVSVIKFGFYTIEAWGHKLTPADYIKLFSFTMNIPKHPQASTRGSYLNAPPYSDYILDFQPFGCINISSLEMAYHTKLQPKWYVDFTTGLANLLLMFENDTTSCIGVYPSQYGVPIKLSQANIDYLGIGSSAVGTIGSLLTGNIGGAAQNIISGINSASPRVATQGIQGSFVQQRQPVLYGSFNRVVLEDIANVGRPLYDNKYLYDISGYTVIDHPHIEITATEQEISSIKTLMSDGFYIE